MDRNLLAKLFASKPGWQGPCTVLLDANASVRSAGLDSIVSGGVKNYAPRISSGRITADCVCLLAEHSALVIVQRAAQRSRTGEETILQSLLIVDIDHIAGVEFDSLAMLEVLGITAPALPQSRMFGPEVLVG